MARSLTKSFIRLIARDDGASLLAALPQGCDPRNFHINGDLLPLRCAMYGAIDCLMTLIKSRPDLADELACLPDGNGERVIDWAAAHMTPQHIAELSALAPVACASPSSAQHWPLGNALRHGRWDSAQTWLDLAPEAAKLSLDGRTTLHLCSEPYYQLDADAKASWTSPSESVPRRLIELGANPLARDANDYSALSRCAHSGSLSTAQALLDALSNEEISSLMNRGKTPFSPLHEAVWNNHPDVLSLLITRQPDLNTLSEKNFGLLHMAIRQNSQDCARILHAQSAPFEPEGASTTCPASAMASSNPSFWIDWLRSTGADMNARDDHGSHWAELAWERLPMSEAVAFWEDLGSDVPLRSTRSLFGPLERAARSDIDPVDKMKTLIDRGILPARIDLRDPSKLGQAPSRQLDLCQERHVRNTTFGSFRHIELGPMWATEPDSRLFTSTKPSPNSVDDDNDDDDDFFGSASNQPKQSVPYARPSLIAYCASRNKMDALAFLIDWDVKNKLFQDADYLCAWREALRNDVNMPLLKTLATAMSSRGLGLWTTHETRLGFERLGPSKARALGAPVPSLSESFERWCDAKTLSQAFFLNSDRYRHFGSFSAAPGHTSDDDALTQPWRTAIKSEHEGSLKLLFERPGSWDAIAIAHATLACAQEKKTNQLSWIIKRLPAQAKNAPVQSPWGREPDRAVALWDQQIRFELAIARSNFPQAKDDKDAFLPEGSISSLLLTMLVSQQLYKNAEQFIVAGLPAPIEFTRLADAIATRADKATAMGADNAELVELRSFCEILCQRLDFQAILNRTGGKPILARLPDPTLMDTFLSSGAMPGLGENNAFVQLCSNFASRLSPSFAERLAHESRMIEPSMPLLVTAALAAMRPHRSRDAFDFTTTNAARLRVERSAKDIDELSWFNSFEQGFCPVAKALDADNVEMALILATHAPDGYIQRASKAWPGLLMKARLPSIAKALDTIDRFSSDETKSASASAALCTIRTEMTRLSELGARVNEHPQIDASHIALGLDRCQRKSAALNWLIDEGVRPSALIPIAEFEQSAERRVRKTLASEGLEEQEPDYPKNAPLICLAISQNEPDQAIVDVCLAWHRAGLPESLSSSGRILIHSLLKQSTASLYEAEILRESVIEIADGDNKTKNRL